MNEHVTDCLYLPDILEHTLQLVIIKNLPFEGTVNDISLLSMSSGASNNRALHVGAAFFQFGQMLVTENAALQPALLRYRRSQIMHMHHKSKGQLISCSKLSLIAILAPAK
jgi:hypothetical protein